MIEIVNCPACDGYSTRVVVSLNEEWRKKSYLAYSTQKYGGVISGWIDEFPVMVVGCDRCGHCWYRYQPSPSQLQEMYAAGRSLRVGLRTTSQPTARMRRFMRNFRKTSASDVSGAARLLDFGAGSGRWSRAALLEGFHVTAYEPSLERSFDETSDVELVHSLEALDERKFEAILIEQVLEHLPDPFGTLLQLKKHCNSLTVLRITVPNRLRDRDSSNPWSTWPFDGNHPHFLAPFEHLHGFTPSSLKALLTRAGYACLPLGKLWREHPLFSIRQFAGRFNKSLAQTAAFAVLSPCGFADYVASETA